MGEIPRQTRCARGWVFAFAMTILPAEPLRADDAVARAREMKRLVQPLKGFKIEKDKRAPVELLEEPLVRWSDPTRENGDGSLWAFGRTGRPIAVVAVELYPHHERGELWAHEFVSLSTGRIEVDGGTGFDDAASGLAIPTPGHFLWTPKEPGITFREFPDAPKPGPTEGRRLRQLKELAERFSAAEYYEAAKQTYSLRLSPHPIHRYHDAADGIVDGAIFQIAHGTNPEVLVLIEAQGQDPAGATWRWAAARLTTAEPTLRLDQKPVWTVSTPRQTTTTDTYCGAVKPREAVTGAAGKRTRD